MSAGPRVLTNELPEDTGPLQRTYWIQQDKRFDRGAMPLSFYKLYAALILKHILILSIVGMDHDKNI